MPQASPKQAFDSKRQAVLSIQRFFGGPANYDANFLLKKLSIPTFRLGIDSFSPDIDLYNAS